MKNNFLIQNAIELNNCNLESLNDYDSLKILLLVENLSKTQIEKLISIIKYKEFKKIFITFEKYYN